MLFKPFLENPCTQRWDELQAHSVGKFCSLCNKSVIDFSSLSIEEFQNKIATGVIHSGICGQFREDQLTPFELKINTSAQQFFKLQTWQKYLLILFFCFGSTFCEAQISWQENWLQVSEDTLNQSTEVHEREHCLQHVDHTELQWEMPSGYMGSGTSISLNTTTIPVNIVLGGLGIEVEHEPELEKEKGIPWQTSLEITQEQKTSQENGLKIQSNEIEISKQNSPKPEPQKENETNRFEAILPPTKNRHKRKFTLKKNTN